MGSIFYGGKKSFFRATNFNVSTKTLWSVLCWLLSYCAAPLRDLFYSLKMLFSIKCLSLKLYWCLVSDWNQWNSFDPIFSGTSSKDSLLSWIRLLEKEVPNLKHLQILFTIKQAWSPIKPISKEELSMQGYNPHNLKD